MKTILTILTLFVFVDSYCQPTVKCLKPTLSISTTQNVQLPNTTANINMSAIGNNPDNKTITYQWVQNSGFTVNITNPTSNITSITGLSQVGMYVITGIATDGCGVPASANDTINVIAAVPVTFVLKLVPNPANHNFTATVSGNGAGKVTLRVYSPTSNILQSASGTKSLSGAYSKLFYIYFYRPGNYTVVASINGTNISQTLIIQ